MRKPYQLPGYTKNSSYYSAPVGVRTHDQGQTYEMWGPGQNFLLRAPSVA